MPNNLTPEMLAALQAAGMGTGGSGWVPQFGVLDGSTQYQPMFDTSGAQGANAATPQMTGFTQYGAGQTDPGMKYNEYGLDGSFQREGEFHDPKHNQLLMAFLAAAGGMAFGLPAMGVGQGAAGGAGAAAGAAGGAPMSSFGVLDATIPWGANGASMVGGAAGGAAGAAAGGGGAPMSSFGVLDSTVPFGATSASLGGTAAAGGLLSGASKWLGPAATAIGALAGSKGQESEQTATKQVPEWIKKYYDDGKGGGVLPMAMGLLNQQNSPERMAQWDQMRDRGMGLLNAPTQRYFGTPETAFRQFGGK